MKATRVAGVVGAVLLIVAGEARAECAWVLWVEPQSLLPFLVPNGFERAAAFDTYNRCADAAKARAHAQAAEMKKGGADVGVTSRVNDQWWVEWTANKPASAFFQAGSDRFMCLPDTVDPRGPKGK